jgi:peptidyl-prolyl cis-trans isomerase-like 2
MQSFQCTVLIVIILTKISTLLLLASHFKQNNSHVVAIKTTGNVFSYEAVHELNIKAKQFSDLMSGEAFKRSDIITLQNPNDPEHMALRDVCNFKHLQTLREDSSLTRASEGPIRHTPSSESVMREIEKKRIADEETGVKRKVFTITDVHVPTDEEVADISEFWALKPTIADVNPGSTVMEHKVSCSLTSSSAEIATSSSLKLASPDEIREARWKAIRKLGKKGYVQLQTSLGNINLEVHCNFVPRTSWNFLTLCQRGYYDGLTFHRLIPGFMAQTGDPTGKGNGGESAFPDGEQFRDEYDSRLTHDKRGVISMANSGVNTNSSQFFITFKATKHLDLKHSIFGTVVGGAATLDRIEEIETDVKSNRPVQEIKIIQAIVLQSPLEEADAILMENVKLSIKSRRGKDLSALPNRVQAEAKIMKTVSSLQNTTSSVGKYLQASSSSAQPQASSSIKDYGEGATHSEQAHNNKKLKLASEGFNDFSGW